MNSHQGYASKSDARLVARDSRAATRDQEEDTSEGKVHVAIAVIIEMAISSCFVLFVKGAVTNGAGDSRNVRFGHPTAAMRELVRGGGPTSIRPLLS
jgi:2-methylaconitate cis-trans-isomerase PrpF